MRVTFASPGRHVELHIPHDGLTMRPCDMWPAGYVSPVINSPVLMSLHDTPANFFFFPLLLQANYEARSQALEQHGCHVSHVTAWLAAQPARAAGASRCSGTPLAVDISGETWGMAWPLIEVRMV